MQLNTISVLKNPNAVNLVMIIYEQLLHFKLLQHWPHGNSHLGDESARSADIQRNPDFSLVQLAT
jgi:hypothetical protein